eukprot:660558-Prorocentrum_minimum.AAC.1
MELTKACRWSKGGNNPPTFERAINQQFAGTQEGEADVFLATSPTPHVCPARPVANSQRKDNDGAANLLNFPVARWTADPRDCRSTCRARSHTPGIRRRGLRVLPSDGTFRGTGFDRSP